MGYWQRVALIRPADNIVPVLSWNLPDEWFNGFCNCHDPTWCIPNGLKRGTLSIINGGAEAMFHEWIEKREERLAREGRSC